MPILHFEIWIKIGMRTFSNALEKNPREWQVWVKKISLKNRPEADLHAGVELLAVAGYVAWGRHVLLQASRTQHHARVAAVPAPVQFVAGALKTNFVTDNISGGKQEVHALGVTVTCYGKTGPSEGRMNWGRTSVI